MKDRVAIPFTSPNPTYRFIREIYETTKLEEVAELLTTNLWIPNVCYVQRKTLTKRRQLQGNFVVFVKIVLKSLNLLHDDLIGVICEIVIPDMKERNRLRHRCACLGRQSVETIKNAGFHFITSF